MFNELTLALHVLLLAFIYIFLAATVRVISRDLSGAVVKSPVKDRDRPAPVQPRLIVAGGIDGRDINYTIDGQLIIGRSPDCDIILDDTFVSAHHARVYYTSGGYWLEDLKSTNGTAMNGKQLEAPVKLIKGSEFKIGAYSFKFVE